VEAELAQSSEILSEVLGGVVEMCLSPSQKLVGFPARSESEHLLDLEGGEDLRPVSLDGQSLESVPWEVGPLRPQGLLDFIGRLQGELHARPLLEADPLEMSAAQPRRNLPVS
jgi:hypothetical protein